MLSITLVFLTLVKEKKLKLLPFIKEVSFMLNLWRGKAFIVPVFDTRLLEAQYKTSSVTHTVSNTNAISVEMVFNSFPSRFRKKIQTNQTTNPYKHHYKNTHTKTQIKTYAKWHSKKTTRPSSSDAGEYARFWGCGGAIGCPPHGNTGGVTIYLGILWLRCTLADFSWQLFLIS